MTDNALTRQPTLVTPEADPEVLPRATRRQFTAHDKLAILDRLATLQGTGQIGAYLREEGLYSSQISAWRQAYDEGGVTALEPRTRGPKPLPQEELARRALWTRRAAARGASGDADCVRGPCSGGHGCGAYKQVLAIDCNDHE